MRNIIVAGSGTDVGKTVVAAIVTTMLEGEYWKPVECGPCSDTMIIRSLIDTKKHHVHEPAYSLKAPVSPHEAADLEAVTICLDSISMPDTKKSLVIEMAGGIFTPLSVHYTNLDLFTRWDCQWLIVSRHYLGSINHTLLTIDALQQKGIKKMGLIFNGLNQASESAILQHGKIPCVGRLMPEEKIDQHTIFRYAQCQPFCL